jgi:hypothetical protein
LAVFSASGFAIDLSTTNPEQRWEKLVGEFRQFCLYRRQKKLIESDMILNSDLPRSIAEWSRSFEGEPSVKKARLDAMFQTEQRRIDDAWLVQDLMAARFNEQMLPNLCMQVAQEVRSVMVEEMATHDRRVPIPARSEVRPAAGRARVAIDDIPGVIDLVLAEDRNRANARLMEPARQ